MANLIIIGTSEAARSGSGNIPRGTKFIRVYSYNQHKHIYTYNDGGWKNAVTIATAPTYLTIYNGNNQAIYNHTYNYGGADETKHEFDGVTSSIGTVDNHNVGLVATIDISNLNNPSTFSYSGTSADSNATYDYITVYSTVYSGIKLEFLGYDTLDVKYNNYDISEIYYNNLPVNSLVYNGTTIY